MRLFIYISVVVLGLMACGNSDAEEVLQENTQEEIQKDTKEEEAQEEDNQTEDNENNDSQNEDDEKEDDSSIVVDKNPPQNQKTYKILSLGDSYTVGEGVCKTCSFPEQLKTEIEQNLESVAVELKVVATTGWTTTNLIKSLDSQKLQTNYDFVTLLIGVNNQFQGISFDVYEREFVKLVAMATSYANQTQTKLVVLSIPDYAFTPFGQGDELISKEIDDYNQFAENYCKVLGIDYLYITDITRDGLEQPELVASDGLHPSKKAYAKFINSLYSLFLKAIEKK